MKRRRTKKKKTSGGAIICGIFRWLARLSSIIVLALIVYVIYPDAKNLISERNSLFLFILFPFGVCLGYIVSWGWELKGSVFSLVCFGCFLAGYFIVYKHMLPEFWFYFPLLTPSVLFIISGLLAKRIS